MEVTKHYRIMKEDFWFVFSVTVKERKANYGEGDFVSLTWVAKGEPLNLVYTFTGNRVEKNLVKGRLTVTDLTITDKKYLPKYPKKYLGTAEISYDDVFSAKLSTSYHMQECSGNTYSPKEYY